MNRILVGMVLAVAGICYGADVEVRVYRLNSERVSQRKVTLTLTEPGGVMRGPWLLAGDAVSQFTDTNGLTTFSNVLVGAYRIDIAGTPSKSFPVWVPDTNGVLNAASLNGTNAAPVFYTAAQVDSLVTAAGGGLVEAGTNTVVYKRGMTNVIAAEVGAAQVAAKLAAAGGRGTNLTLYGQSFFNGTNFHGDTRMFADPESGDFRIFDSRGDIGVTLHHDTLSAPYFQSTDPESINLWEVKDPYSFAVRGGWDMNGVLWVNLAGGTNLPMTGVTGLTTLSNRVAAAEVAMQAGVSTNGIAVSGDTTDGTYKTIWTNAAAGSNWVGTVSVTVVGSGPVNRYVEEITWSVVRSNGVTWIERTNGVRRVESAPSYLRKFDEVDEFTHLGAAWTTGPFGLYASTTGGTVGNANPRDGAGSIAMFGTSTSASAVASTRSGVNVVDFSMVASATNEWRLLVDDLSTATEHFTARVGFQDTFAATPNVDAACFVYSHTTNSGKFLAMCSSNSVVSTADTGLAVVADTWYRLGVVFTNGSALFFTNGSLAATITSNVPGVGNSTGIGALIFKQAGTTGRYIMLDYCRFAFELQNSR